MIGLLLLTPVFLYYHSVTKDKSQSKKEWKTSRFVRKHAVEDNIEELSALRVKKEKRREKFRHRRMDLGEHFEMCDTTGGFQSRYHMSFEAFERLVEILNIDVNEVCSLGLQQKEMILYHFP